MSSFLRKRGGRKRWHPGIPGHHCVSGPMYSVICPPYNGPDGARSAGKFEVAPRRGGRSILGTSPAEQRFYMGLPFLNGQTKRRDQVLAVDLGGRTTKAVHLTRRGEIFSLANYALLDAPVY